MFKKLVALTLAALMFLNPMTAFAVTWDTVVAGLNSTEKSYHGDGINALVDEGAVTVSGDGTIENFYHSDEFSSYEFTGTITIDNQIFSIWVGDASDEVSKEVYLKVDSGVTVNAQELNIGANGNSIVTFQNKGTVNAEKGIWISAQDSGLVYAPNTGEMNGDVNINVSGESASGRFLNGDNGVVKGVVNGDLSGYASDGAYVYVENKGTLNGDGKVAAIAGGKAEANNNEGVVTGNLYGFVIDGGKDAYMYNAGTVEGNYGLHVQGVGEGTIDNGTTGRAGSMSSIATDGSNTYLYNAGTVDGEVFVVADQAEANVFNRECGTVNELYVLADGSGTLEVQNEGAIKGGFTADIGSDANVTADVQGNVKNATIFINTPTAETFSPEKIKEILGKVNLPEETLVSNELWTYDSDGNFTARYQIDENGVITLIESFVGGDSGEGDDPANWTKERIRHDMEEKRKAQAIGGVYGSPYWLKQLYLGYMSLNLRLFEGEKQLLFKENLSWLVEERAKQITFQIKLENPESLTMRLDGTVIQVLEQAEISTIAIVDGDGDLFMTYKVADLKGARELYGLACEDYIVVGAADADVMKIGADGRIVPIEGEEAAEEAPAAEAPAA